MNASCRKTAGGPVPSPPPPTPQKTQAHPGFQPMPPNNAPLPLPTVFKTPTPQKPIRCLPGCQHSRRALGLQFNRAPTDNDRGGYVGRWDVAGLLEPALGPFGARSGWERREADGAVLVTTEFKLRPRAPKPRLCKLFYKVSLQNQVMRGVFFLAVVEGTGGRCGGFGRRSGSMDGSFFGGCLLSLCELCVSYSGNFSLPLPPPPPLSRTAATPLPCYTSKSTADSSERSETKPRRLLLLPPPPPRRPSPCKTCGTTRSPSYGPRRRRGG